MTGEQAKAIRMKMGLNQTDFWSKLGVTQSGSSRYEGGRRIPMPTQTLLMIAYGPEHKAHVLYKFLRAWGR